MFENVSYPQLADADLTLSSDDDLLNLAELVWLDFQACERSADYEPEDHGLALDFDKVRDELHRRDLVEQLDLRWGVRDEMMLAVQRAEERGER